LLSACGGVWTRADELLLRPPQDGQRHPALKKGAAGAANASTAAADGKRGNGKLAAPPGLGLGGNGAFGNANIGTGGGKSQQQQDASWNERLQQRKTTGARGETLDSRFPARAGAGGAGGKNQPHQSHEEEWEPTGDPENDKIVWEKAKKEGRFKHLDAMPTSRDDFFGGRQRGGGCVFLSFFRRPRTKHTRALLDWFRVVFRFVCRRTNSRYAGPE
jgi:hypothetical protein